ncbi:uncharacterized protein K452DRAFT_307577 [Aplosporella prunicola CBS 121167]|uniref:Uncharacterized protein n=1 Tax=Aplosporella prunicola CBS 121167 TaxID=1176127 RepID=A0A6A6BJ91_9PEZI|nr:uncharacterized protein K452DRAFT_307577 [Aplosporella prunicola CBS 121167]KAF2143453.1 hypothetical protein K452DRAFT_307577 [Aplosporella prunicola CBS 121167]
MADENTLLVQLAQQLGAVQAEAEHLAHERDDLKTALDGLNEKLSAVIEERNILAQRNAAKEAKIECLEKELHSARNDLNLLRLSGLTAPCSEWPSQRGPTLSQTALYNKKSFEVTKTFDLTVCADNNGSLQETCKPARHNEVQALTAPRSTDRALSSKNWRAPLPALDEAAVDYASEPAAPPTSTPVPVHVVAANTPQHGTDVEKAVKKMETWLEKTEKWASRYGCTVHASIKAKEASVKRLVDASRDLLHTHNLEEVFLDMRQRKWLVASLLNRHLLLPLFDEGFLDCFSSDASSRLVEIRRLKEEATPKDPQKLEELVTEETEMWRAVYKTTGFKQWRNTQVVVMAKELGDLLMPIISPGKDRQDSLGGLQELALDAFRIAFMMRCMPRSWFLKFDNHYDHFRHQTMKIRYPESVKESEYKYCKVVFGITPHLVSRMYVDGGMVMKEFLKSGVMVQVVNAY